MLIIEKVLLLRNSSIFHNCKEVDLVEIASICQEHQVDKNTPIFKKGDAGNCVYFIYKGNVSIHDGEHQLAELSENEIFGELSLLDAETRSASASCHTDCTLFRIDQEPFYELIDARPEVARGFIKILCQRLRAQNEKSVQSRNL